MKYIFSLLLCVNVVLGMEEAGHSSMPVVVDYMAGDQLPEDLTSAVIFGATPRISRFSEFVQRVVGDVEGILSSKPKGMRRDLKRIKKENADTLRAIADNFKNNSRSDIALKCFFSHGFNKETLVENMNELAKSVQRCRDKQNLIHVLLPTYFDASDFKDIAIDQRSSFLKRFLEASAQFYQQLYTDQKPKQSVYIVVPPLEEFVEKINSQDERMEDAQNDDQCNDQIVAQLLKKYMFDKGVSQATLLNQNEDQLCNLGKELKAMDFSGEDITLQSFNLSDARCKETKIFTPYAVPQKIPLPPLSCVVSDGLVKTFEEAE